MATTTSGAKWFIAIMVYFVFMIFIVTAINEVAIDDISNSGDDGYAFDYCSSPRTIYIPNSDGGVDNYNGLNDYDDIDGFFGENEGFYEGTIGCQFSKGVFGEDICVELDGCSWEDDAFWFWQTSYTCVGNMNYSFLNENNTWYSNFRAVRSGSAYIKSFDITDGYFDTYDICSYPDVLTNESLCDAFSCTCS